MHELFEAHSQRMSPFVKSYTILKKECIRIDSGYNWYIFIAQLEPKIITKHSKCEKKTTEKL